MNPGDLGCYDPVYVQENAPRWRNLLHSYFRAEVSGMENIPDRPFLAVGNHSGGILIPDTLVWLSEYHSAGRKTKLLTLAHDGMFSQYPAALSRWASRFGAIRARPEAALQALKEGYSVQVYPGGDLDACRPFSQRNRIVFAGRTGYVELAREAGVSILPVASRGAHSSLVILRSGRRLAKILGTDRRWRLGALPLSLSLPWGLWLGPLPGYLPLPTKIEIEVLPPIEPKGSNSEVDREVRGQLQASLVRRGRR
jgi:1-acyl-sn-glycerol-3-phosphate acyltransferase